MGGIFVCQLCLGSFSVLVAARRGDPVAVIGELPAARGREPAAKGDEPGCSLGAASLDIPRPGTLRTGEHIGGNLEIPGWRGK